MSTFLLGGRAWLVAALNHEERLVRVRPAPRGKKPSWGGFVPQFLGFELCQQMKAILTCDDDYAFIDAAGKAALAEWRGDLGQLLRRKEPLRFDGGTVTWWTVAGGRINQTLKYALEWKGSWKVIPDNFAIRIEGDGVSHSAVAAQLESLRAPGFWKAPQTRQSVLSRVPEYRLSKFQRVLPDPLQVEMVGDHLVDFDGAESFLAGQEALGAWRAW